VRFAGFVGRGSGGGICDDEDDRWLEDGRVEEPASIRLTGRLAANNCRPAGLDCQK
jgi:hypothetical protein